MYVKRLRLRGLKMLDRDIPEGGGPLPEAAHRRLLLQGGNGSGKSTILTAIRTLWETFGELIDVGRITEPTRDPFFRGPGLSPAKLTLLESMLTAVELGDFPTSGHSLWIGVGRDYHAWEDLKRQHPEAAFAGRKPEVPFDDSVSFIIDLPPGDWKAFRLRSMVGSEPRPNVVSFPPDDRRVSAPPSAPRLIDTTALNWSAAYSPDVDLDSVLLTVNALRPADFESVLRWVNQALRFRDKQIIGWGQNGRLVIEGRSGGDGFRHTVDALSSGERQFLLMVAYVAGFLRPGGIVLIDEPDLHIHIAMVTQLMQTIDLIVRERKGQLIVASHSELVWDFFSRDTEKIDLTAWRRPEA